MSTTKKIQVGVESLNPDNPISRKEDDLLGRYPLAVRIAYMINNLGKCYEDSVVIGIEGEWGEGKTSFINLILKEIDPIKNLVMEFNPWNFSDQGELIKDFFASIIEKLEQYAEKSLAEGLIENITKYASKLKPSKIKLNPSISIYGTGGSLFEAEWDLDNRDDLSESLKDQRDKIDVGLKKLNQRIVIVIDDIDRLDSAETKLIFKLVKLTSSFPNTVFLLAYDRIKVGDRLTEKNTKKGVSGEDYLKKIVQVPFLIPKPASEYNLEHIFKVLADSILGELNPVEPNEKNWDEDRFWNLVNSNGFRSLFPTIRDIRRYTNSLHIDLKIIDKEEINLVDFVGIEAIRVFAPKLYLAMTNENSTFTLIDESLFEPLRKKFKKVSRKEYLEKIFENIPEGLEDSIKEIIHQLFPQVEPLETTGKIPSHIYDPKWDKALRVCAEDTFDQYFLLLVPSTLFSERERKDLLSVASDVNSLRLKLEGFQEQGNLLSVSRNLPDLSYAELNDQQRMNMIIGLFDFAENVSDDGFFGVQARSTGNRILEMVEKENRADFVVDLIHKTAGFLIMNRFLNDLAEKALIYEDHGGEESLLTKSEVDRLRDAYVKKIKLAAEENSLVGNKGWGWAMRVWGLWGSKEEAEGYTEELIKDEGILTLLREFYRTRRSPIDKSPKEMMEEFIELDKLDKRVDELDASKLSEEDAEIIELYKNPPKDPGDNS